MKALMWYNWQNGKQKDPIKAATHAGELFFYFHYLLSPNFVIFSGMKLTYIISCLELLHRKYS